MDVAFKAERGTEVRMEEFSNVGEDSQSCSVVGHSRSEMGTWMPVESQNLVPGDWASALS